MYWIQIDNKSSDDLKCISDGRPFVPKLLIKCIVCISRINFIICATFDSIIHKISVIKNWCNVININLICATFHLVHLLSTQSLKIHWFYVAYSSNNWVDPLAIQVNLLITIHMPHHSKASCLTVLLCMTSRCSQVVGMSAWIDLIAEGLASIVKAYQLEQDRISKLWMTWVEVSEWNVVQEMIVVSICCTCDVSYMHLTTWWLWLLIAVTFENAMNINQHEVLLPWGCLVLKYVYMNKPAPFPTFW